MQDHEVWLLGGVLAFIVLLLLSAFLLEVAIRGSGCNYNENGCPRTTPLSEPTLQFEIEAAGASMDLSVPPLYFQHISMVVPQSAETDATIDQYVVGVAALNQLAMTMQSANIHLKDPVWIDVHCLNQCVHPSRTH